MEMKVLYENISEWEILFTLVVDEVGDACILSQIIKLVVNSSGPQECITRPFTRPNLRGVGKVVLGLFILFILVSLRTLAQGASQQLLQRFLPLKISEIFSDSK